jgi:hypothetical protein
MHCIIGFTLVGSLIWKCKTKPLFVVSNTLAYCVISQTDMLVYLFAKKSENGKLIKVGHILRDPLQSVAKHSSLLRKLVNYGQKVYNFGPRLL